MLSALRAEVTPGEREAARNTLGDALYPLFDSMQAADQRHGLDVFERLLQDGAPDAAMLQVALIHDCGKGAFSGARITLADRIAFVLLSPVPGAIDRAARRPAIAALRDHAATAISLARAHGAGQDLIALLEEMEGLREATARGRALKRADDFS